MTDTDIRTRLSELLRDAGQHHHAAYAEADGVDPEWALWYASYVQTRFWDAAGRIPTRSELVYLLVAAERAHAEAGGEGPWPDFYAEFMLARLR